VTDDKEKAETALEPVFKPSVEAEAPIAEEV